MNGNGNAILSENIYVICFSPEIYFLYWNGINIFIHILFIFSSGKPVVETSEWDLHFQTEYLF